VIHLEKKVENGKEIGSCGDSNHGDCCGVKEKVTIWHWWREKIVN